LYAKCFLSDTSGSFFFNSSTTTTPPYYIFVCLHFSPNLNSFISHNEVSLHHLVVSNSLFFNKHNKSTARRRQQQQKNYSTHSLEEYYIWHYEQILSTRTI